jgi:hypothetical protein
MVLRTKIIDVTRKPLKCPVCGERVVDIIYGTGDMTEIEFVMKYRRDGIMGGDTIPRRPPIWACVCGCRRFRKVNEDGTDAPVKVKMLKDVRKKSARLINWETTAASQCMGAGRLEDLHKYEVEVVTELGEKETLYITACNGDDAKQEAKDIVAKGLSGLEGNVCVSTNVKEE